jgi:hypothetical protein
MATRTHVTAAMPTPTHVTAMATITHATATATIHDTAAALIHVATLTTRVDALGADGTSL